LTADPFTVPSSAPADGEEATFTRMADLVDKCLLIKPLNYEDGIASTHPHAKAGDTYDRVTADVTVIDTDNPAKSVTHEGLWITQGRVIGKTKRKVGGMVLGILTRPAPTHAAPNPPYDLIDPTPAHVTAARAFLAAGDEPPF
jgi:hypothetical protein